MKPIEFKQQTAIYAKNQPPYLPLPVYEDAEQGGRVFHCMKDENASLKDRIEEAERKGRDLCEVHGVTLIENSSLKESLKGAVKVLNEIHSFPLENSHVHFDYGRIKGIVDIKLVFLKSKFPDLFGEK